MAFESSRPVRSLALPVLASFAVFGAFTAHAQEKAKPPIYQCIDPVSGKKITSDRPILECAGRDQRKLNPDGSLNSIVPPPLTADERAAKDQKERDEDAERVARNDAIRRDRNLMQRFPSVAEHHKARAKALDELRAAAKNSGDRLALLAAEKKKLDDEKEFFVNDRINKPLPNLLKQKIDANEAAIEAQKSLAQNQQSELLRINALYDAELARLKKLWSGAQPGSLGPAPGPQSVVPPVSQEKPATAAAPALKTADR